MRKTILFGMVLLLMPLAIALDDGDIITQDQLNSIDADTFNLHCQLEDAGTSIPERLYLIWNKWFYVRRVSCWTLSPLDDGTYQIVRKEHRPKYLAYDFIRCALADGISECNSKFNARLVSQHNAKVKQIRDQIRAHQTDQEPDLSDFIDGFGI